jgi:hypothetical protein
MYCKPSRTRTVTVSGWLDLTRTHSSRVYAHTHADVKEMTRAYEKSGRQSIPEVRLRACIGARPGESRALVRAAYQRESDRRESALTQCKHAHLGVCTIHLKVSVYVCVRRRVCMRSREKQGGKEKSESFHTHNTI